MAIPKVSLQSRFVVGFCIVSFSLMLIKDVNREKPLKTVTSSWSELPTHSSDRGTLDKRYDAEPTFLPKDMSSGDSDLASFLGPCDDFKETNFASLIPTQEDDLKRASIHGGWGWTACDHVSLYGTNTFPYFLARLLAFEIPAKSVLEFGCGLGLTADYISRFSPHGARVICIEPYPMLSEVINRRPWPQRPVQLTMDVFQSAALDCRRHLTNVIKFDLVYSFEVAEHVPLEVHDELADFLVQSTNRILFFSAGRLTQKGQGHIGLRPVFPGADGTKVNGSEHRRMTSWKEMFESRGLIYMPHFRQVARYSAHPIRSYDIVLNLLVFRQADTAADLDEQYEAHTGKLPEFYGGQKQGLYGERFHADNTVRNAFKRGVAAGLWPELDYLIHAGSCDKRVNKSEIRTTMATGSDAQHFKRRKIRRFTSPTK